MIDTAISELIQDELALGTSISVCIMLDSYECSTFTMSVVSEQWLWTIDGKP